jgi:hypothetical protein
MKMRYLEHGYIAPVTQDGAELAFQFLHLLAMMLLCDGAVSRFLEIFDG